MDLKDKYKSLTLTNFLSISKKTNYSSSYIRRVLRGNIKSKRQSIIESFAEKELLDLKNNNQ